MHKNIVGQTVAVRRPPIHPTIISFADACFIGTLLTDIAYWRTAEMMWADFSSWLVSAGIIVGWLAAVAGLADLRWHRYYGLPSRVWAYAIGNLIVLVIATLNMLVHTRDAWTSVVPWGLTLSVSTVVVLCFTTWIGWTALYRREVEISVWEPL